MCPVDDSIPSQMSATTSVTPIIYPGLLESAHPETIMGSTPSQQTSSLAFECYLTHAEPIFHIAGERRCGDLLKLVFDPESRPTEADTCELSAIAAVGCQFNNIDIPDTSLATYAQYCTRHLLNTLAPESLQGMRCFLGMSLRWQLENLGLARTFVCKQESI